MTPWRRLLALSALASLALSVGASQPPASAGDHNLPGGLRVIGTLPMWPPKPTKTTSIGGTQIVKVLPGTRRLLTLYNRNDPQLHWHLREYSLTSRVPTFLRDGDATGPDFDSLNGPVSGNLIDFDQRRQTLLILRPASSAGETGWSIIRIDEHTLKYKDAFPIWRQLPGFMAYGLTYSVEDDRIYLLGDFSGHLATSLLLGGAFAGGYPAEVAGIAAIEASTGRLAWMRPVAQCQNPLVSQAGAALARSRREPVLYFACFKGVLYPGLSGVVRLHITPTATPAEAANFKTEFFPISGSFASVGRVNGRVTFDPATERLLILNASPSTPGVWVFDGRLSAWIGEVSVPAVADSLGVNEGLGHVYVGLAGRGGFLVVADGRATPAPQGKVFPVAPLSPLIAADPQTRRLFPDVADLAAYGAGSRDQAGALVVEDLTPDALPEPSYRYDDLTNDVAEGPGTYSTYAGTVNGFGFHASMVGGYGGATSLLHEYLLGQLIPPTFGGLSPGDRGLYLARVPSLDLRNVGASAAAQAVAPDTLSDADLRNQQEGADSQATASGAQVDTTLSSGGYDDQGSAASLGHEAASHLAWPWDPATCLDSGGGAVSPATESGPGGTGAASVQCNLATDSAHSSASADGLSLSSPDGSITLKVAGASITSEATRPTANGLVTATLAEAHGIEIAISGAGKLNIGSVSRRVKTSAHGRPGTALAGSAVMINHATLYDSKGAKVFACDACAPGALIDQANGVFATHLELSTPQPAQPFATPRGAFAAVRKTDRDYYDGLSTNNDSSRAVPALQAVVVNDSSEKSRLLLQFAAIQASSIYGISTEPKWGSPANGSPTVPASSLVQPPLGDEPSSNAAPDGLTGNPSANGRQLLAQPQGQMILVRSPKEAILMAMIFLLVATAVGAGRRTRLLSDQLDAESK